MANLYEFDEQKLKEWHEWLKDRPQIIKDLAKQLPPNKLYLLKTSNHKVTLISYEENGTVTVNVSGDFNRVIFERNVFGVNPENLEECDIPNKDGCGLILTESQDIDAFVDAVRPIVLSKPV